VKYFVVKHFDRHSITWPICSKKKKITWPIWSLKGEQKWQQLLVSVGSSRAAPSCRVEKKKKITQKKKKMREKSHLYFLGVRAPHSIEGILEKIFIFYFFVFNFLFAHK
jgi:hypothetical protein